MEGTREVGRDEALALGFEQQHTALPAEEESNSSMAARQQHVPFGPQDVCWISRLSESRDATSWNASFSDFVSLFNAVLCGSDLYCTAPCLGSFCRAVFALGAVMPESKELCSSVKDSSQVM
jgi:hypothetical protein